MNEKISDGIVGSADALDLAWMGRLDCGCVVAVSIGGPDDFAEDPDIVSVEEATVEEARQALTFAHSRPTCEVLAERDAAREWAVRLEQQNAEALRLATTRLDDPNARGALFVIARILGDFPDDETEQQ